MHQGQVRGFSGVPGWLKDMTYLSGAGVGYHVSQLKNKNYVIYLTDTDKSSDKFDVQGKNSEN